MFDMGGGERHWIFLEKLSQYKPILGAESLNHSLLSKPAML
jgi:hypothetical protein